MMRITHVQGHLSVSLFALEVLGEFEIRALLLHLEPLDFWCLALVVLLGLDLLAEELRQVLRGLGRVAPLRRAAKTPRGGKGGLLLQDGGRLCQLGRPRGPEAGDQQS